MTNRSVFSPKFRSVEYYSGNLLGHIQINALKGKLNVRIAMEKVFYFKLKILPSNCKTHVPQCICQDKVTE
jgi:hypothetical protein